MASAHRLESLAIPSGHLILSGFMDFEEGEVVRAFGRCPFESRAQEDEWVCVSLIVE